MFSIAQKENHEVLSHFKHQNLILKVSQHPIAPHCQMHFSSQEIMGIDGYWK